MSENSHQTNRIQCPGCERTVVVPRENSSPYIRCGLCHTLFELRNDSRIPQMLVNSTTSKKSSTGHSPATRPDQSTSPYGESGSSSSSNRESFQIDGRSTRTGRSGYTTFAFIFFGLATLIYFAVSKSVTIPFQKRSVQGITYRITPDTQTSRIEQRTIDSKKTDIQEFTSMHEVNLNGIDQGSDQLERLDPNTVKVSLNGRNWSLNEIRAMLRLERLTKLSYTDVNIQLRDLVVLRLPQLTDMDLSRSKWKRGQLLFNGSYYPGLANLDLSFSSVRGFALSGLDKCQQLSSLNLRGTSLDDDDIAPLFEHSNLTFLDLCETSITYEGLSKLKLPNLKTLKISEGMVTTSQHGKLLKLHPGSDIIIIPRQ